MLKTPDRHTLRLLVCTGILCVLFGSASLAQDLQPPASGYLEARLRIGVDAGRMKADEAFQAEALSSWSTADCTMLPGARIYGKVVSGVRHTKSSPQSTLTLLIDGADCKNHRHAPLALHILEIIVPDAPREPVQAVLPLPGVGLNPAAAAARDQIEPDSRSSVIHVGEVVGEKGMRLEIAEGPQFAELLRSNTQTVRLLAGTRLVLGTKEMIPADQQLHFDAPENKP
jgi:hypothetical protein